MDLSNFLWGIDARQFVTEPVLNHTSNQLSYLITSSPNIAVYVYLY